MNSITKLVLCGVFTCTCILWYASFLPKYNTTPRSTKKPNIVFILADDLGWSDVGFNNPYVITPNIDRLAREGVILNQTYAAQSCGPSRATLMSGYFPYRLRYSVQLGAFFGQGLPLNLTLLPRTMQGLSYSTYMVGKWDLGFCKEEYTPTRRGFDKFYGYYMASGDHYTHSFLGHLDLHDNMDPDWSQNGTYSSYLYTHKAVEFIEDHDKTKPMFLYVAYQNVHSPLQVPKNYVDMYRSVKNVNRRKLLGMVSALDDGVGKIVKALKRNKLWENTVLLFLSDNGGPQNERCESSNWPLLGKKLQLFEGGTRVVGFVHGDMLPESGYRYHGMIHFVDWYPTLVGLAGGEITDQEVDGIDVWRALSMNRPSPRKEFVYNVMDRPYFCEAIRVGDYKMMRGSCGDVACRAPPPETEGKLGEPQCIEVWRKTGLYLYNLKDDPIERYNLAEKMSGKVRTLTARLEEYKKKYVPSFKRSEARIKEGQPDNFGGVWSPGWC
ncbi:arylsulfatase J-like isoform X2 [Ptychodera flava]|uniref:arylsulfatase J-like isoform X2 n=1 Tax=Ptychodera flava TaxID=63121 RepID=UPI003969C66D